MSEAATIDLYLRAASVDDCGEEERQLIQRLHFRHMIPAENKKQTSEQRIQNIREQNEGRKRRATGRINSSSSCYGEPTDGSPLTASKTLH